jgi:hypothetical protein
MIDLSQSELMAGVQVFLTDYGWGVVITTVIVIDLAFIVYRRFTHKDD